MEHRPAESESIQHLIALAVGDDSDAQRVLFDRYRDRLKRMVGLRLDRRVQCRIDASDVVQEAFVDAAKRLKDYAANPQMDFFVWLRWLTGEKLLNLHRHHLGAQKRDARQEVSLYRRPMPEANSISLAQQLLGQLTSPTQAVMRAELQLIIQEVLNAMDPIDREVLVLRHFEQLTTSETAQVLGIKRSAASKRYISALKRLKQAVSAIPGIQQHLN
jgi:RNA polymerase sigma-70 factor (ECF subfamily)